MVLGLLRKGLANKAYEIFKRITPGYINVEDDPKQNTPPYIYANGHYGPEHRNNAFQVEFTWITGSMAWHYNNILAEMMGFKTGYDSFSIEPVIPDEWDEFTAVRSFRGKTFRLTYKKGYIPSIQLLLNGQPVDGQRIHLENCESENQIEITLPS